MRFTVGLFLFSVISLCAQEDEKKSEKKVAVDTRVIESPTKIAPDLELKLKISSINALLIREISRGNYGGTVAKLTATVVPSDSLASMPTKMNQKVGTTMHKAFSAVNRAIFLKHKAWPAKKELELGFADKYGGKDGPSAALAYALLLESMISGQEIRSDLACTGDMNSDETVQPIGGLRDKIRAARKGGCQYILIPKDNVNVIMDMAVDRDLKDLLQVQVISIDKLDDALKVVYEKSSPEVTEALANFEKIKKILSEQGLKASRESKEMDQMIDSVKKVLPNHQSVKMISMARDNKLPRSYSVLGSFQKIDKIMQPLQRDKSENVYTEVMAELRKNGSKLHPKMKNYVKKISELVAAGRNAQSISKKGIGDTKRAAVRDRFNRALKALKDERDRLLEDPEIKDSLSE